MTVFATVLITLVAAHQVGDHWVQTQSQAERKSLPGWAGRRACAAHVATYTATALVAVLAVAWRTGLPLGAVHLGAGLAVSAVSHYLIDRRTPLITMCRWLGKSPVWLSQQGGFYAMDQSWHHGWLLIATLIVI
ncbi:MAG: DUF3307 domain-containing protein [Micromonosporaceae bacterium]|nr:DUF3307 domain-containing protein [Micromonosporaceae bacterium]